MLPLFPLLNYFLLHLWKIHWLPSPFLILLSCDMETNPGFRHNSGESFSICHRNLNVVSVYKYTKFFFQLQLLVTLTQNKKSWHFNDSTTSQGNILKNITSKFRLQQIIHEPSYILDHFSSCIDLIFTSQSNLITELGVPPSLYPNCHHQVVYAKFNQQIYYPPQYYQDV